ncbi:Hypothetical protein A7982_08744 [Minicystis rosea]|nr:Hypothetical protein A7982_08744 [Minicystis rosea]
MFTGSRSPISASSSEQPSSADPPAPASAVHAVPVDRSAVFIQEDWPNMDELNARYLHRVLDLTGGNKTQAAEILGIDRRTVDRMLARERKQGRLRSVDATAIGATSEPSPAVEGTAARRALVAFGTILEQMASLSQQIRAVEVPSRVDASAWRRALRRLSSGMVEVQASARELTEILRTGSDGPSRPPE